MFLLPCYQALDHGALLCSLSPFQYPIVSTKNAFDWCYWDIQFALLGKEAAAYQTLLSCFYPFPLCILDDLHIIGSVIAFGCFYCGVLQTPRVEATVNFLSYTMLLWLTCTLGGGKSSKERLSFEGRRLNRHRHGNSCSFRIEPLV